MWQLINTNEEILLFMERVCYFHDCCIKEIRYLSGAYVSEKLSMFPLNNRRELRVVIQRQSEMESMIEMEFQGLKTMKLSPVDERFTCEIVGSSMIIQNGNIYWGDCNDLSKSNLEDYASIWICASKLRWRCVENQMGEKEYYHSDA